MNTRGFTLVELVVVIVLIGIISAIAIPRLSGRTGFESRGVTDKTQALIKYAQKTAIAQRRTVYVTIASSTIRACYDSLCTSPVLDPVVNNGSTALISSGINGINFTASPVISNFTFNGLGKPSVGVTITVNAVAANDTSRSIVVETETGFVHSP